MSNQFPLVFKAPYPKFDAYNSIWISDREDPLWRIRVRRASGWIEIGTLDTESITWAPAPPPPDFPDVASFSALRAAVADEAKQSLWVRCLGMRDTPDFQCLYRREQLQ